MVVAAHWQAQATILKEVVPVPVAGELESRHNDSSSRGMSLEADMLPVDLCRTVDQTEFIRAREPSVRVPIPSRHPTIYSGCPAFFGLGRSAIRPDLTFSAKEVLSTDKEFVHSAERVSIASTLSCLFRFEQCTKRQSRQSSNILIMSHSSLSTLYKRASDPRMACSQTWGTV